MAQVLVTNPYVTPEGWRALLRSKLTLTIIALFLTFLFIRLGFWQLARAHEKQALRTAIEARAQLPPLALNILPTKGEERGEGPPPSPSPLARGREGVRSEELRYRKVVARGTFESQAQILLDNRTYQGRAGYHVITPLRIAGTDRGVLVNRGWVELGASRDVLPAAKPPQGEVEVHGIVETPSRPLNIWGMMGKPDPAWGRRWPYLDIDYFQTQTGYALEPFLILQDPSDPGGLIRVWPQLEIRHEIHIAYAIQWLAFAVIVLIVYLRLFFSRPKTQET